MVIMSKRTKERARERSTENKPPDVARLRAKFGSMTSRRQPVLELVTFGPIVDAKTPAELVEKVDAALVEEATKGPQN